MSLQPDVFSQSMHKLNKLKEKQIVQKYEQPDKISFLNLMQRSKSVIKSENYQKKRDEFFEKEQYANPMLIKLNRT